MGHHQQKAHGGKSSRIGFILSVCIVSGFFSNILLFAEPVKRGPPWGAPGTIAAHALRFSIPNGFIDATNYSYASPNRKEMVSVNLEELNPPSSLDEIYEDKKKSLINGMEGRIQILSEGRIRMAGTEARTILFAFSDTDSDYMDHWAIGVAGKTMILLSYAAPEKNLDTFNHVVQSVVLAPRDARPAMTGYNRYQAGRIYLDVPKNLREPEVYTFRAMASDITITARIYDDLEKRPALTLKDFLQEDSGNGAKKIKELKESRVAVHGGGGHQARYIVDDSSHPYRPRADAVCRAVIKVGDEWVHLYGRAPKNARAGLHRAWDELLTSIRSVGKGDVDKSR
ncbi:MAG: hypothetical protein JW838_08255 [Spirochaetes bacterium]|nr:hypothetical protein [Spirochaetota bacterium]